MDALPLLLRYREAARHVWNCFLRQHADVPGDPLADEHLQDDWDELRQVLFRAIVLRNTGNAAHGGARLRSLTPVDFLRVEVRADSPAMISRLKGQEYYWDHPVHRLSPGDDLRFIDFFDFDQWGSRDFLFCQVEIRGNPKHPEVVGHLALIEVQYLGTVAVEGAASA